MQEVDAAIEAVLARTKPPAPKPEPVGGMAERPTPKGGDTLILPPDRRVKIVDVFDGMVWIASLKPILVGDLEPSGEPDTWVYKGDTLVGGFPVTSAVT